MVVVAKTLKSLGLENLDPFKLNMLKLSKRLLFIGETEAGKSLKMKACLHHYSTVLKVRKFMICSGSLSNGDYDCFPQLFCRDTFSLTAFQNIWHSQDISLLDRRRNPDKNCEGMLVIDDLAGCKEIHSLEFEELLNRGRNKKLSMMFAAQYIVDVPKKTRGNFSYVFIIGEMPEDDAMKLKKQYAPFLTPKLFMELVNQNIKNHGCLVIDKTYKGSDMRRKFFNFRIPDEMLVPHKYDKDKVMFPDFPVGCEKLRRLSEKFYFNHSEDARRRAEEKAYREKQKEKLMRLRRQGLVKKNRNGELILTKKAIEKVEVEGGGSGGGGGGNQLAESRPSDRTTPRADPPAADVRDKGSRDKFNRKHIISAPSSSSSCYSNDEEEMQEEEEEGYEEENEDDDYTESSTC